VITPRQTTIVKSSWNALTPYANETAHIFYTKLFQLDPSVKSLFATDMAAQRAKLVTAIGWAVGTLDNPEALRKPMAELGLRHASYGVRAGHYATVGAALLHALATALGPSFTDETRQAWATTYGAISRMMLDPQVSNTEQHA
jgi:hemoglobin-like flavoprotein